MRIKQAGINIYFEYVILFYSTFTFWKRKSAYFETMYDEIEVQIRVSDFFSGPGDSMNRSYVWTLWVPQRAEGVKS